MNSKRACIYAEQLIDKYSLDLSGLKLMTEAASGAYLYNPMIGLLAGAESVMVCCRDSKYGRAVDIYSRIKDAYNEVGLNANLHIVDTLSYDAIRNADIVTNSGHLRPINRQFIAAMKPGAVIPLMWEPWELREGEVDIQAAKHKGVLIMGTNEHEKPCDMRPYSSLTALNLLMQHSAPIVDDHILVIGNQGTLAIAIERDFKRSGFNCRRLNTHSTHSECLDAVNWATYILVAEHSDKQLLIGGGGVIDASTLRAAGISAVGVIAGVVDKEALEERGISVFPEHVAEPGYMSYLPSVLGPYPVMDLFTAGLKVGEAMARARKRGLNPRNAAADAARKSPAMDLEGNLAWI